MELFPLLTSFLLGAVLASFAGVVAARLHTGQSTLRGRSRCDACGTVLGAYDLVPIISYLATGRRARCCRARLSWLSPLSELALGGLFALSYHSFGLTPALPLLLAALTLLLALVFYDLAHMILPPLLLGPFVLASACFAWLEAPSSSIFFLNSGVALALGGVIALLHYFSRGRAMGLADAPLTLGLGLLAGPSALAGFAYAFWIGAVIGILILLRRPRGSRMGVEVPFAPYLAAGFLLALFTPWNPFIIVSTFLGGSP